MKKKKGGRGWETKKIRKTQRKWQKNKRKYREERLRGPIGWKRAKKRAEKSEGKTRKKIKVKTEERVKSIIQKPTDTIRICNVLKTN